MQAPSSFGLVAGVIAVIALLLALSTIAWAPILAVPFFIVGFGAFLVWRGKRRADVTTAGTYSRERAKVPETSETVGDPVRDSGAAEAAASGTAGRHRAGA